MTAADEQLLQDARQYVTDIFTNRVNESFLFHSIHHTLDVIKAIEQMADHYQLTDEERLPLLLAGWFHDTGYSGGETSNHEELSKRIASRFLFGRGVGAPVIDKVSSCIMATRMPQSPKNLVEQIICDADLFHLGTEAFAEQNKLLRKEMNLLGEKKISKKEWEQQNIRFLQQHRYFTDYARTRLEPVKQQHLKALLEKSGKQSRPEVAENKAQNSQAAAHATNTDKARKAKENKTERSISTMFRIMSENHVSLSQMADSKANIMISVNTIVMSIMVSVLLGKLQFYPEYIIPTIILLGVCLSAVVFSILATRPNVNRGTFTREDILNKKVNLLFFGNFYNMSLQEYDWAMKEMMNDWSYLNSSMVKDIYFLGVVLARKYKYLRISYNIFMYGLVIAILAFAIAFFFSNQAVPN